MAQVTAQVMGTPYASPVVLASGPAGFGTQLIGMAGLERLGAVTTKTITLAPRPGNPQPRLLDSPAGSINSIGLENPGLKVFRDEVLPLLADMPTRRIVSISGGTAEEALAVAEGIADASGIDAVELNLSCPNVDRTMSKAQSAGVGPFVGSVRKAVRVPLFVKLAGDSQDFIARAGEALDAGADGLTLINTLRGMRINFNTGAPLLHREAGGLCGPAIFPIALLRVFEARRAFPDAPIIGTGGVVDLQGALEMIFAGANLVGIGFGFMVDPLLPVRVAEALETWLCERGIKSVAEIQGAAHRGGIDVC